MKKNYALGVIGGGFMARAIIQGIVSKRILSPECIIVSEPISERADIFSDLGAVVTCDNRFVAQNSEYLLFAVKPQVFQEVAEGLNGVCIENAISIMAGKTKDVIKRTLGTGKVARAMPNLPCSVGEGMIGIDTSDFFEEERAFIYKLFESTGKVVETEEGMLNAVTGVSGSGPAYVYLFLQALVEAGVSQGFTEEQAKQFAVQTVKGGIKLVEQNPQKTLQELIDAVSSKGGTTVAALTSFANDGFKPSVARAVDAAVKRAMELSE